MSKPDKPPGKPPGKPPKPDTPPITEVPEGSVVRRLAIDCRLPSFVPSEGQPFDLDACTINDGDDITQLLTDIQERWPDGFYVRAPSKSLNVVCDTIAWPSGTKTYVFLEDEEPSNQLLLQHTESPKDFWTMWRFENFDTVKIGGPNHALTFKGNHPGLANCDVQAAVMRGLGYDEGTAAIGDANKGLIEFSMTDGSLARLADVRANIRFSQQYSIYAWGSFEEGGTTDKIERLNVSGLHYATSGVFFHQGVKHAWSDPGGFVVSDPYVRGIGWTGVACTQTQGDLPMGCNDQTKDQVRFSSFSGYYTDSITGGVTIEYGASNWVQRYTGRVGNSADDPYVVRVKDWYVSGPGTPYPAGVRVKKSVEATFFKGEPHDAPGERFVRFEKLPDTYGSGPGSDYLEGCSPSNAYNDGPSNFARLENSLSTRVNRGWHVTFAGDWNTNFVRSELFLFAFNEGRSYGHTLEAAAGTTIVDTIAMHDTDTVMGAGTFTDIRIANHSPATPGRDNTIADTTVAGSVTLDPDTGTTTVRNVTFSGVARAIITVDAGSVVDVIGLSAPSGSTITGAGTLIYDGIAVPLPHTIVACACHSKK